MFIAPGHYHPENYNPEHSPAFTFGHKTLVMPGKWEDTTTICHPRSYTTIKTQHARSLYHRVQIVSFLFHFRSAFFRILLYIFFIFSVHYFSLFCLVFLCTVCLLCVMFCACVRVFIQLCRVDLMLKIVSYRDVKDVWKVLVRTSQRFLPKLNYQIDHNPIDR